MIRIRWLEDCVHFCQSAEGRVLAMSTRDMTEFNPCSQYAAAQTSRTRRDAAACEDRLRTNTCQFGDMLIELCDSAWRSAHTAKLAE
jgi:hypothetical protein